MNLPHFLARAVNSACSLTLHPTNGTFFHRPPIEIGTPIDSMRRLQRHIVLLGVALLGVVIGGEHVGAAAAQACTDGGEIHVSVACMCGWLNSSNVWNSIQAKVITSRLCR